jgi:hypothetical protein
LLVELADVAGVSELLVDEARDAGAFVSCAVAAGAAELLEAAELEFADCWAVAFWSAVDGVAADDASEEVAGAAAAAVTALVSEVLAALALSDFWQVSDIDFTLLTLYVELSVESMAPCNWTMWPTFFVRSSWAPANFHDLPDWSASEKLPELPERHPWTWAALLDELAGVASGVCAKTIPADSTSDVKNNAFFIL